MLSIAARMAAASPRGTNTACSLSATYSSMVGVEVTTTGLPHFDIAVEHHHLARGDVVHRQRHGHEAGARQFIDIGAAVASAQDHHIRERVEAVERIRTVAHHAQLYVAPAHGFEQRPVVASRAPGREYVSGFERAMRHRFASGHVQAKRDVGEARAAAAKDPSVVVELECRVAQHDIGEREDATKIQCAQRPVQTVLAIGEDEPDQHDARCFCEPQCAKDAEHQHFDIAVEHHHFGPRRARDQRAPGGSQRERNTLGQPTSTSHARERYCSLSSAASRRCSTPDAASSRASGELDASLENVGKK